jgi:hypothetical protein
MQSEILTNKKYLEDRLNELVRRNIFDTFSVTKDTEDKDRVYFQIDLTTKDINIRLYADLQETMEITINDYFHDVTDYLIGDYRDTIDWYLEIANKIAQKEYTVVDYARKGKSICRVLELEVRGRSIAIGDFHNHFKIFAKKTETVGGEL